MNDWTIRQVIHSHQPIGGGYGIGLQCSCGEDYSAEHQLDKLEAAGYDPQGTS
jgi:hypothetical protein